MFLTLAMLYFEDLHTDNKLQDVKGRQILLKHLVSEIIKLYCIAVLFSMQLTIELIGIV
jgi:hypothetical protein